MEAFVISGLFEVILNSLISESLRRIKQFLFCGNECIGYVWGAHPSFLFQLWKLFWICEQASRWSYCLLLFEMFANWSWFLYFGSYLFLLLASLTAQELSLQEMQPWSTTCSQVAPLDSLMVIQQLTVFQLWWRSTFGGAFLLVEFFFTQLRLCPVVEISFLLLLLLCSPVRCGGALGVASSGSHSYTAQ